MRIVAVVVVAEVLFLLGLITLTVYPRSKSSRPYDRNKVICYVILMFFTVPIVLGITYLVWFANQCDKAGNEADHFYKAVQEEQNLKPYICNRKNNVEDYLASQNKNVGKITEFKDTFGAGQRKRGTPFPEKEFIVDRPYVIRNGIKLYPEVEVVNENGKFKVCGVTEGPNNN